MAEEKPEDEVEDQPTADEIRMPKAKFEERLERAGRSRLTALFGTSDEAKIKERLATAEKLEKEAAERAAADKSELERARDEAAKAKAEKEAAEEAAELANQRAHIARLGAENGITDIALLEHKIFAELDGLPEGEELDEEKYVEELLKDARERIALGVDPVPTPDDGKGGAGGGAKPPLKPKATTAPTGTKPPVPAPKPGAGDPPVDVSKMDPAAYRAWKAAHGIR